MRIRTGKRNGSATVEFCITLPLYLFVFFGVLFFGQATFVDQEMNLARAFATFNVGQDSDGQLNQNILSSYMGSLNVEAIGRKGLPVVPTQDVDQNGVDDHWVDADRIQLTQNAQREQWLGVDVTDDFPSSTGVMSNFSQPLSPGSGQATNRLWLNSSQTVVKYTYTPSFVRFIYAEQPLTTQQYMTYQLGGSVPTQDCRDCHSSLLPQTNERLTALRYRGEQQGSGTLPAAGEEDFLWSHLKVKDMLQYITVNNKTPLPESDAMPPADTIDPSTGELVRPGSWDPDFVLNYQTQSP